MNNLNHFFITLLILGGCISLSNAQDNKQLSKNDEQINGDIQTENTATSNSVTYSGEFVPYKMNSRNSYSYQESHFSRRMNSPSCLSLLRQKYGQGYTPTDEAVKNAANDQTKALGLLGLGYGAVTGTAVGFATGNPILGVGVGLGGLLAVGIGQSIERGQISRNGYTVSAAEKVLAGVELTKKERKAFERARKKVSKRAYKNKNAISDSDFAETVLMHSGVNEQLFCDVDNNGNFNILPQEKKTIKALAAHQKCKDASRGKIPSRERVIYRSAANGQVSSR